VPGAAGVPGIADGPGVPAAGAGAVSVATAVGFSLSGIYGLRSA
jgi:hypothetical protein